MELNYEAGNSYYGKGVHPIEFTIPQLKAMATRYMNGESTLSIGLDYGVTAGAINMRLRKMGVTLRSPTDHLRNKRKSYA